MVCSDTLVTKTMNLNGSKLERLSGLARLVRSGSDKSMQVEPTFTTHIIVDILGYTIGMHLQGFKTQTRLMARRAGKRF